MDRKIQRFIANNEVTDKEFDLISTYCGIRYASGISQGEIAKKTGLAKSTIARLEKNLHSASLTTFIKILDSLGYHLEIKKD